MKLRKKERGLGEVLFLIVFVFICFIFFDCQKIDQKNNSVKQLYSIALYPKNTNTEYEIIKNIEEKKKTINYNNYLYKSDIKSSYDKDYSVEVNYST